MNLWKDGSESRGESRLVKKWSREPDLFVLIQHFVFLKAYSNDNLLLQGEFKAS